MQDRNEMEPLVAIVGFLGAGKTTLLKHLIQKFLDQNWNPYVILNDYTNADFEAQEISQNLLLGSIKALAGNCICCDGIGELRGSINDIPSRNKPITLIEANGTSDAGTLLGFLGVGLNARYAPPIQISVVDVKNWQQRGYYNDLEVEQVRAASLIYFSHTENVSAERLAQVESEVREINSLAPIVTKLDLDAFLIPELSAMDNPESRLDHSKAHWASCSIDLPALPDMHCIEDICFAIPDTILRIKGCAKVGTETGYSYFERRPDGLVSVRPYSGTPSTGPKLLTVGPGSDPDELHKIVEQSLEAGNRRAGLGETTRVS